jgi:hypothetical protein
MLAIIFTSQTGLGIVKYYSSSVASSIAKQLNIARKRNPNGGFDLSVMNIANSEQLFRKKSKR